jgi:hypothetical protein
MLTPIVFSICSQMELQWNFLGVLHSCPSLERLGSVMQIYAVTFNHQDAFKAAVTSLVEAWLGPWRLGRLVFGGRPRESAESQGHGSPRVCYAGAG